MSLLPRRHIRRIVQTKLESVPPLSQAVQQPHDVFHVFIVRILFLVLLLSLLVLLLKEVGRSTSITLRMSQ